MCPGAGGVALVPFVKHGAGILACPFVGIPGAWCPATSASCRTRWSLPLLAPHPAPVVTSSRACRDLRLRTRVMQGDRREDFVNFRDKQVDLVCATLHNATQVQYRLCEQEEALILPFLSEPQLNSKQVPVSYFESSSSARYEDCLATHRAMLLEYHACVASHLRDFDAMDQWCVLYRVCVHAAAIGVAGGPLLPHSRTQGTHQVTQRRAQALLWTGFDDVHAVLCVVHAGVLVTVSALAAAVAHLAAGHQKTGSVLCQTCHRPHVST
jgi:hypothetical protein